MTGLERDTLLEVEHRGWRALCTGDGGRFYGELMTPDALVVLVNGMVLDRGSVAASLDDAPPWSAYRLEETRLVPTGTDAAALVYRATASRPGETEPFTALMSSHYRLVEGTPRLTLYQQTTITH